MFIKLICPDNENHIEQFSLHRPQYDRLYDYSHLFFDSNTEINLLSAVLVCLCLYSHYVLYLELVARYALKIFLSCFSQYVKSSHASSVQALIINLYLMHSTTRSFHLCYRSSKALHIFFIVERISR